LLPPSTSIPTTLGLNMASAAVAPFPPRISCPHISDWPPLKPSVTVAKPLAHLLTLKNRPRAEPLGSLSYCNTSAYLTHT
jgi:hypothetical protein